MRLTRCSCGNEDTGSVPLATALVLRVDHNSKAALLSEGVRWRIRGVRCDIQTVKARQKALARSIRSGEITITGVHRIEMTYTRTPKY